MLAFALSIYFHPLATLLCQLFGDRVSEITDGALAAVSPYGSEGLLQMAVGPERRLQVVVGNNNSFNPTDGLPLAAFAVNILATIVIYLALGFWYKSGITDRRKPAENGEFSQCLANPPGVWKYQTFDCCQDSHYCLYGLCCLGSRLGDTYEMTGAGPGYWTWVVIFIALQVFARVLNLVFAIVLWELDVDQQQNVANAGNLFYYIPAIILALWMATRRKELRQRLGDPNASSHFCMDFVCYGCCGCCTAIQEARQVDEATGTKTTCCMKLDQLSPGTGAVAMGQPAYVAQPVGQPVALVVAQPVVGNVVQPGQPTAQQQATYGNGAVAS
jgi:Cys-rich protein (TIGR01571 family)